MKYARELLKGNTDSLLLSLLREQPMYGYQIVREMGRRSLGFFQFKEGTLYPALHRLERQGLVEGRWGVAPSGQRRRYYYITQKGLSLLASKTTEWLDFSRAVNLILNSDKA